MKTILVLTAVERAFYSATIEYQLIEPVLGVLSKKKNIKIIFVSLIPFTFYFSREDIKGSFALYRTKRKKLKEKLKRRNASIFFIPVLFPLRHKHFYLRFYMIPFFLITNIPLLAIFVALFRPTFIHARGYPAALLAFVNKKVCPANYIFDMRDVYTKKGVEAGVFSKSDISTRLWHLLEKITLRNALRVIVTSKPFMMYAKKRCSKEVCLVRNSVNKERFSPNRKRRESIRNELGLTERFVLIHSGTFSTDKDMILTARYFKKWIKEEPTSFLLIFTPNERNKKKLLNVFTAEGLGRSSYRIIVPQPEEVPELLRAGDIGLHLESKALATEYCIAIKDGEYLATGLPVVCTPYLKGIAPIIKEYNAGIITDPERETGFTKERYLLNNLEEIRKNAKLIVDEVLSTEVAVRALYKCYEGLIQNHSLLSSV